MRDPAHTSMLCCSPAAPLCCACCCAGAIHAHACTPKDRHSYCSLCDRRILSKQPHRPHGDARAHKTCANRINKATAVIEKKQTPRSKRPYDSLGSTQKWKRRKQAREMLQHMRLSATGAVCSQARGCHPSSHRSSRAAPLCSLPPHSLRADDDPM